MREGRQSGALSAHARPLNRHTGMPSTLALSARFLWTDAGAGENDAPEGRGFVGDGCGGGVQQEPSSEGWERNKRGKLVNSMSAGGVAARMCETEAHARGKGRLFPPARSGAAGRGASAGRRRLWAADRLGPSSSSLSDLTRRLGLR
jgi:hypothetical protein